MFLNLNTQSEQTAFQFNPQVLRARNSKPFTYFERLIFIFIYLFKSDSRSKTEKKTKQQKLHRETHTKKYKTLKK